jgi:hypothetical protein
LGLVAAQAVVVFLTGGGIVAEEVAELGLEVGIEQGE